MDFPPPPKKPQDEYGKTMWELTKDLQDNIELVQSTFAGFPDVLRAWFLAVIQFIFALYGAVQSQRQDIKILRTKIIALEKLVQEKEEKLSCECHRTTELRAELAEESRLLMRANQFILDQLGWGDICW